MDAACRAVVRIVELARGAVETRDRAARPLAPVGALVQHQEVVAADMAEEVAHRIAGIGEDRGRALDHLVALPVAVLVVEGLEVVQVDITGAERRARIEQPVDMLVQRNIARQEGQRIGIARRLHADLGDGADQVGAGAQPGIAAAVGDDETIGQIALVAAGQALGHGLDGGAAIEADRLAMCHQDAGLLAVQLAMKRRGITIDEALPVDDADWLAVRIEHRQRMQAGVGMEQRQHLVVGLLRPHRRRASQQLARIRPGPARTDDLRKHRDLARRQRLHDVPRRRLRRLRQRPAEQIALAERHAKIAQHRQLLVVLDAFGDHAGAQRIGQAQHGAHQFQPPRARGHAVHQRFVELDELRRQLDQQVEIGMAGAEVVQRIAQAEIAQHHHRVGERRHVADAGLLGQLDHHAPWRHRVGEQRRHAAAMVGQQLAQRHRTEIDEQQPRQLQFGKARQRGPGRLHFQRHRIGGADGKPEQRFGRGQRRALGSAQQRLVSQQIGRLEAHDRLEDGAQRRQTHRRGRCAGFDHGNGHGDLDNGVKDAGMHAAAALVAWRPASRRRPARQPIS